MRYLICFLLFIFQSYAFARLSVLNNTNQIESKNQSSEELSGDLSIRIENALSLKRNNLLTQPYNWSISIPYTEVEAYYKWSKNLFVEIELEFSYTNQDWLIKIEDLFLKYKMDLKDVFKLNRTVPVSLRWGYFRVNYIKSNSKLFNKKTLVKQNLFPYGDRNIGAVLKLDLYKNFSFLTALQYQRHKRESDGFKPLKLYPVSSAYLLYKYKNQKVFLGYSQKKMFLEGDVQSFGSGADLQALYKNYFFKFKTELWNIRKSEPQSRILSYYVFPYLKWKFLGAGFLAGAVYEKSLQAQASQFETVAKLDFYFTDKIYFSIEKIQEYSRVYKQNSWNFSIKTDLKFKP